MKAIVIYCSKRGTTKKYAEWIAEDLGCKIVPVQNMDVSALGDFDIVIYGGWTRGGGIVDLDKIRKNYVKWDLDKKSLLVYSVGIARMSKPNMDQMREINMTKPIQDIPLFILPGAYHKENISGVDKIIMKATKKILVSGGITKVSEELNKHLEEGLDEVDRKCIDPIIEEVRRIDEEHNK